MKNNEKNNENIIDDDDDQKKKKKKKKDGAIMDDAAVFGGGHVPRERFCDLPGDPSLILNTNVDLGDKKAEILTKCTEVISAATGKSEAYVGEMRTHFSFFALCVVFWSLPSFVFVCFWSFRPDFWLLLLLLLLVSSWRLFRRGERVCTHSFFTRRYMRVLLMW